ncbi:MAG: exodeoxyribonuclease VII small subunit [Christensenellales bacterium]
MDLEKKLKEIEEITNKLENPDLSMNEGVKLYEDGVVLAKECMSELNTFKGKINVIKKELDAYNEEALD